MEIIRGENVDLITPFPLAECRRVFGWSHCYRTLTETDDTPNDIDGFEKHMQEMLQVCPSWGIIDKNHITNIKHEAPLVGIVMFEPAGIRTGYFHVATARKAFKTGLIDEAVQLTIKYLFNTVQTLTRLGAYMDEKNAPAKALAKRAGFKYEGLLEDAIVRDGIPRNVIYFGLTRRRWNQLCLFSQQSQRPLVDSLEVLEQQQVEQVLEAPSVKLD